MDGTLTEPQSIPKIDSIQELAHFWDTHELSEFDDELEEVTEPVFGREAVINLHLPPKEGNTLREIAGSKGMTDTDLVREWVLEKIERS